MRGYRAAGLLLFSSFAIASGPTPVTAQQDDVVGPRSDLPATEVRVVDLTPRFLAFYDAALEENADEARRWELWQEMYGFAALPPVPERDSLARQMLAGAWPRYPSVIDRIREGAEAIRPTPDSILRAVATRLEADEPVRVELLVFAGDVASGGFFAPQDGRMVVALPVEEEPDQRTQTLVHEFTHVAHHALGHLSEGWERSLARTLFAEGLANRMQQAFFPDRPAAAFVEHRPGWFAEAEAREAAILRGLRESLTDASSDQVMRFTMGTGTTGIEREAYYAGWVVVGYLLEHGWDLSELARVPEDEITQLVAQTIDDLLDRRADRSSPIDNA